MLAPDRHSTSVRSSCPSCRCGKETVFLKRRAAFTLVELLVVIAIIAVLAALSTVGILRALDTAKQTRIKAEVDALDLALKAYKEKYGSYPPCDLTSANKAAIVAHVIKAFPRYFIPAGTPTDTKIMDDLKAVVEANGSNYRPDQALVFWLNGFNTDPTQPFSGIGGATPLPKAQRTPAFFDFDQLRLVSMQSTTSPSPGGQYALSYVQIGSKNQIPYVYFDGARTTAVYNSGGSATPQLNANNFGKASAGMCQPYWYDANGDSATTAATGTTEEFAGADSFQIIAPGLDEVYGNASAAATLLRFYPTGFNYDIAGTDDDNITNFCNKARLIDAKP